MRKNDLLVREVEGEVLVLDTDADQVHQLNTSASIIWRLHGEGMAANEVAMALVLEFDIDHDTAVRDVEATLERLRGLQLID